MAVKGHEPALDGGDGEERKTRGDGWKLIQLLSTSIYIRRALQAEPFKRLCHSVLLNVSLNIRGAPHFQPSRETSARRDGPFPTSFPSANRSRIAWRDRAFLPRGYPESLRPPRSRSLFPWSRFRQTRQSRVLRNLIFRLQSRPHLDKRAESENALCSGPLRHSCMASHISPREWQSKSSLRTLAPITECRIPRAASECTLL
jgi:hypothetical protein